MRYFWVYGTDMQRLPAYASKEYDWSRNVHNLQWWCVCLTQGLHDRLADLVDLRPVKNLNDTSIDKPDRGERPWSFRPSDVLE